MSPFPAIICSTVMASWFLLSPAGAASQDTTAQMKVAAPTQGEVYVNYGQPPRVRIFPSHRLPPPVAGATGASPEPTAAPAPMRTPVTSPSLTGQHLDAFLSRSDGQRIAYRMTERGPALVRIPDDAEMQPDTLFLAQGEDGDVQDVPEIDAPQIDSRADPRIGIPEQLGPSTVPVIETEVVERILLDRGLFRSVSVQFEFDRSRLLETSEPTLDALADVMRRHPEMRIEIGGHTDSVGDPAYNRRLSERRAEEVRESLIDRGIDGGRLEVTGYGESEPLLPNRNQTTRALNRRVDFRIISDVPESTSVEDAVDEDSLREALEQAIREALRESLPRRDR